MLAAVCDLDLSRAYRPAPMNMEIVPRRARNGNTTNNRNLAAPAALFGLSGQIS
jgi:hypothetical protein